MKRLEQESNNIVAMDIYNEAMKEFHNGLYHSSFERLDYCQAWVLYTDNYILLKSYNTFIGAIEISTGTLVDVLRVVYGYTATSAKHIAKFRHYYPITKEITAR